jgi:hypothetical protein
LKYRCSRVPGFQKLYFKLAGCSIAWLKLASHSTLLRFAMLVSLKYIRDK